MQDDFFTSPLPDRSNVSSLRNVGADTGDSLGTDLLRLLELSPPSSTFGTKLCRNISFPNRPRLSVPPSIRLHGAPTAAAAEGQERDPAGGRAESGRADTRCPELGAVVRHSAPSFLEEQRPTWHGCNRSTSAQCHGRDTRTGHSTSHSDLNSPRTTERTGTTALESIWCSMNKKFEPCNIFEHSL